MSDILHALQLAGFKSSQAQCAIGAIVLVAQHIGTNGSLLVELGRLLPGAEEASKDLFGIRKFVKNLKDDPNIAKRYLHIINEHITTNGSQDLQREMREFLSAFQRGDYQTLTNYLDSMDILPLNAFLAEDRLIPDSPSTGAIVERPQGDVVGQLARMSFEEMADTFGLSLSSVLDAQEYLNSRFLPVDIDPKVQRDPAEIILLLSCGWLTMANGQPFRPQGLQAVKKSGQPFLRCVMQSLPALQAAVISRRYAAGMTIAQLAQLYDITYDSLAKSLKANQNIDATDPNNMLSGANVTEALACKDLTCLDGTQFEPIRRFTPGFNDLTSATTTETTSSTNTAGNMVPGEPHIVSKKDDAPKPADTSRHEGAIMTTPAASRLSLGRLAKMHNLAIDLLVEVVEVDLRIKLPKGVDSELKDADVSRILACDGLETTDGKPFTPIITKAFEEKQQKKLQAKKGLETRKKKAEEEAAKAKADEERLRYERQKRAEELVRRQADDDAKRLAEEAKERKLLEEHERIRVDLERQRMVAEEELRRREAEARSIAGQMAVLRNQAAQPSPTPAAESASAPAGPPVSVIPPPLGGRLSVPKSSIPPSEPKASVDVGAKPTKHATTMREKEDTSIKTTIKPTDPPLGPPSDQPLSADDRRNPAQDNIQRGSEIGKDVYPAKIQLQVDDDPYCPITSYENEIDPQYLRDLFKHRVVIHESNAEVEIATTLIHQATMHVARAFDAGLYLGDKGQKYAYNLNAINEIIALLMGAAAMRYMVLVTGSTGAGKSTTIRHTAEAMGWMVHQVPVRSSWRDPEQILGYLNPIDSRQYIPSALLDAIGLARHDWLCSSPHKIDRFTSTKHAGRMHVIILEEVGMANPDQYLADVLQLFEPSRPSSTWDADTCRIRLYSSLHRGPCIPPQVAIPPNVIFVGTANPDQVATNISQMALSRSVHLVVGEGEVFAQFIGDKGRNPSSADSDNGPAVFNWPRIRPVMASAPPVPIKPPSKIDDRRRKSIAQVVSGILSGHDSIPTPPMERALAYTYASMTWGFGASKSQIEFITQEFNKNKYLKKFVHQRDRE